MIYQHCDKHGNAVEPYRIAEPEQKPKSRGEGFFCPAAGFKHLFRRVNAHQAQRRVHHVVVKVPYGRKEELLF